LDENGKYILQAQGRESCPVWNNRNQGVTGIGLEVLVSRRVFGLSVSFWSSENLGMFRPRSRLIEQKSECLGLLSVLGLQRLILGLPAHVQLQDFTEVRLSVHTDGA